MTFKSFAAFCCSMTFFHPHLKQTLLENASLQSRHFCAPQRQLVLKTMQVATFGHHIQICQRNTATRPKLLLLFCPILDFLFCEEMSSATQQPLGNIWEYSQTLLLPDLCIRLRDGLVIFKQIDTKEIRKLIKTCQW